MPIFRFCLVMLLLLSMSFSSAAVERERIGDLIPSCALQNEDDGYDCVAGAINNYLSSDNVIQKKTKGYVYYVGYGSAKFPPESENYEQSVMLAHDQAYYNAISTALKETNSYVRSEVVSQLIEDTNEAQIKSACQPDASKRLVDKALIYAEAKIDSALTEMGRSTATVPTQGQTFKCQNPLFRDSFERMTVINSMKFLRGVGVVHSIVAGQSVGVVVVVGGKLASAAGIIARQERPGTVLISAEDEIRDKLALDFGSTEKLRALFGTRLFFLSNGEPAVVSFGMAQVHTSSTKSTSLKASKRRAAKERADNFARAQFSVFAGTSAQLEEITKDKQIEEEFLQYADNSNYFDSGAEASISSYLSTHIRATSEINIKGVRELFSWNYKADNGSIIEGVVLAWSPSMMVVSENPELVGKEQTDTFEGGSIEPEVRISTDVKEDW